LVTVAVFVGSGVPGGTVELAVCVGVLVEVEVAGGTDGVIVGLAQGKIV
jgi:hypothetical protein